MSVCAHRRLLLLLVPSFIGLSPAARAHNSQRYDLQIITGDQSRSTTLIVSALRNNFPAASVSSQVNRRKLPGKTPIYIAVGPEALRYLSTSTVAGPIISTFTSHKVFHAIIPKISERNSVTAIYADPSPAQQFELINLLYSKPIKVGVILSSENQEIEGVLRRSVSPRQAEVTYERLAPNDDINRVLTRMADVQAILAIPDSAVYNAETIRNILVSTYRRNQAVIGFSAAIVKAGALATIYSEIDDIVAQVDELVSAYEATGRLPEPQFPKFFDVTVNEDVARSLNIVISDRVPRYSRKPSRIRP